MPGKKLNPTFKSTGRHAPVFKRDNKSGGNRPLGKRTIPKSAVINPQIAPEAPTLKRSLPPSVVANAPAKPDNPYKTKNRREPRTGSSINPRL